MCSMKIDKSPEYPKSNHVISNAKSSTTQKLNDSKKIDSSVDDIATDLKQTQKKESKLNIVSKVKFKISSLIAPISKKISDISGKMKFHENQKASLKSEFRSQIHTQNHVRIVLKFESLTNNSSQFKNILEKNGCDFTSGKLRIQREGKETLLVEVDSKGQIKLNHKLCNQNSLKVLEGILDDLIKFSNVNEGNVFLNFGDKINELEKLDQLNIYQQKARNCKTNAESTMKQLEPESESALLIYQARGILDVEKEINELGFEKKELQQMQHDIDAAKNGVIKNLDRLVSKRKAFIDKNRKQLESPVNKGKEIDSDPVLKLTKDRITKTEDSLKMLSKSLESISKEDFKSVQKKIDIN